MPPTPNKTGTGVSSSSSSVNCTMTAVPVNDIIVIDVHAETTGSTPTVTNVTATGLTFARRGTITNGTQITERWWAAVSSTFTGTITANFGVTIDDATIHGLSITGANTGSPWATVSSVTGSGNGTTMFTTSTIPDGVLLLVGAGNNRSTSFWTGTAVPTGLATSTTLTNGGAVNWEYSALATLASTSGISGSNVGWSANAANLWTMLVDGVVGGFAVMTATAGMTVGAVVTELPTIALSATGNLGTIRSVLTPAPKVRIGLPPVVRIHATRTWNPVIGVSRVGKVRIVPGSTVTKTSGQLWPLTT